MGWASHGLGWPSPCWLWSGMAMALASHGLDWSCSGAPCSGPAMGSDDYVLGWSWTSLAMVWFGHVVGES